MFKMGFVSAAKRLDVDVNIWEFAWAQSGVIMGSMAE